MFLSSNPIMKKMIFTREWWFACIFFSFRLSSKNLVVHERKITGLGGVFFDFASKGLARTCTLFIFSFISFAFKGPGDFTRQRLFSLPLYSLHSSIKYSVIFTPMATPLFSFFDHRKSILCVYSHLSFSSFIDQSPFRCFTVVCTFTGTGERPNGKCGFLQVILHDRRNEIPDWV